MRGHDPDLFPLALGHLDSHRSIVAVAMNHSMPALCALYKRNADTNGVSIAQDHINSGTSPLQVPQCCC